MIVNPVYCTYNNEMTKASKKSTQTQRSLWDYNFKPIDDSSTRERSERSSNKRARTDDGDAGDGTTCSEIFRLVTRSNFLSIQDLGKFLLFTSNSMTKSMYAKEEVWALLLLSRFRFDLGSFPSPRIPAKTMFLSFMAKERQRPLMPIRDLQYSPQDYQLIVNVFQQGGGRAIASRVVSGDDAPSFFSQGKFEVEDVDARVNLEDMGLRITVHILRLVDGQVVCLFDSTDFDMLDCDLTYFGPGGDLEFSDLAYSQSLDNALIKDSGPVEFMDGIAIEATVTTQIVSAPEEKLLSICECGDRIVFGYKVIKTIEVSAQIDQYDEYISFPKDSAVTFAHYLETMRGWDRDL